MFARKRKVEKPFVSAVIVAAGSSTRMGGINKLLLEIHRTPVIAKTLRIFDDNLSVKEIVLVCRQQDILEFSQICKNYNIKTPLKIISGGATRTKSTLNGLMQCSESAEYIAIHDGARPLVTDDLITNVVNCAIENGCAIPAVLVKDTLKVIENGICISDIDRANTFSIQTPQVFKTEIIKECTENAVESDIDFTDDSSCVGHFGNVVHSVLGDYDNIKITTPEDISVAHLIMERRGDL